MDYIFSMAVLSSDVSCQCIRAFLQDTYVGLGFDLSLVLVAPFRTCKWTLMVADSVQDVDKYFQMTTLNTSEESYSKRVYRMEESESDDYEEPGEDVEPEEPEGPEEPSGAPC